MLLTMHNLAFAAACTAVHFETWAKTFEPSAAFTVIIVAMAAAFFACLLYNALMPQKIHERKLASAHTVTATLFKDMAENSEEMTLGPVRYKLAIYTFNDGKKERPVCIEYDRNLPTPPPTQTLYYSKNIAKAVPEYDYGYINLDFFSVALLLVAFAAAYVIFN